MVDFLMISTKSTKNGIQIYPKFKLYPKSKDLMIRGGDFYAIWIEEEGLWSTNEDDALAIIDIELTRVYEEYKAKNPEAVMNVLYTWDSTSGSIDAWHKYCQKQMRDSYTTLDQTLIFANTKTTKENYASKRVPYALEKGNYDAWDKLVSTLYDEKNRHKIEWSIGSIVNGASRELQKFCVFYGASGTGKSTIINIIQDLFQRILFCI